MKKSNNNDSILNCDVEQHDQITQGEWYFKASQRKRTFYDRQGLEEEMRTEFKEIFSSLMSGAVAGAVAKTAIAPLDRTKIIFQTSNKRFTVKAVVSVLKDTFRHQGFTGLFRGNSATMMRIVPYASIQFTAHEQYKQLLRKDGEKGALPPLRRFAAGSLAGITAAFITYPLDMVRARLAITQKMKYRSLRDIFVRIYKDEGWRTFYRGYLPTLVGIVPYAGISFFTYETCKKTYSDFTQGTPIAPHHRLAFGACAGLFGQSATYPLDIIRRRMQTAGLHDTPPPQYRHMWSTAKYVYQTEGLIKGLYKGLSMNWIKGPIAVGISFTTFDLLQAFFFSHFITDSG